MFEKNRLTLTNLLRYNVWRCRRPVQRLFTMWLKHAQPATRHRPASCVTSKTRPLLSEQCACCTTPQSGQHSTSPECSIVVSRIVCQGHAGACLSGKTNCLLDLPFPYVMVFFWDSRFVPQFSKPRHNSHTLSLFERRIRQKAIPKQPKNKTC